MNQLKYKKPIPIPDWAKDIDFTSSLNTCPDCDGSGRNQELDRPCDTCDGEGSIEKYLSVETCQECDGNGYERIPIAPDDDIDGDACKVCRGYGEVIVHIVNDNWKEIANFEESHPNNFPKRPNL